METADAQAQGIKLSVRETLHEGGRGRDENSLGVTEIGDTDGLDRRPSGNPGHEAGSAAAKHQRCRGDIFRGPSFSGKELPCRFDAGTGRITIVKIHRITQSQSGSGFQLHRLSVLSPVCVSLFAKWTDRK